MIRLVTFDALHTLITPRLPIYLQYSQSFQPFLGLLPPPAIRIAFKSALKQLQSEHPVYATGYESWWAEVIRRTAVGAGAQPIAVDKALPEIVPLLLKRFSSKEGYKLFDDALPTLHKLEQLQIRTALVSNTDSRILDVLADLDALKHLDPVLISETEGVEKPNPEIFRRACLKAGVQPEEAIHVGDEVDCDYFGASAAGMIPLLLRRPGPEGEAEHKEDNEELSERGIRTISSLSAIVQYVINSTP